MIKKDEIISPSYYPKKNIKNRYNPIRQGPLTNNLTKIMLNKDSQRIYNECNEIILRHGGLVLSIPAEIYKNLEGGLRVSVYRLLDALIEEFTKSGAKDTLVEFPLVEYMEKCNLKNKKELRKQVLADIETLKYLKMYFEKSIRGEGQSYSYFNIYGNFATIKNGIILFKFHDDFFVKLKQYPIMPYPEELYRINPKRNPHSYFLGRKIVEHKNMNRGKANENIISVETLLKNCPLLPVYKDLDKSKGKIRERIMNPFERDMDKLNDIFTWEYCHRYGNKLSDEELINFNYAIFCKCLVQIFWRDYPKKS